MLDVTIMPSRDITSSVIRYVCKLYEEKVENETIAFIVVDVQAQRPLLWTRRSRIQSVETTEPFALVLQSALRSGVQR